MIALITGGTTGIGKDIAINLAKRGYDLLLVSRKENDLDYIKSVVKTNVRFLSYDLSSEDECFRLLEETKDLDIDIFVNNAGYGDIGRITNTDIKKEINMVKLNDIATLILCKAFILRFMQHDKGHVMFVASAAAFGVAPYMNVYYATKSFVYSLAHGYYRELKDMKSHVRLSVLCPGPVKTNFETRANAKFNIHSLSSEYVGKYAVKKMLKGKFEIVPGFSIKLGHLFSHMVPKKLISKTLRKQSEMK
jgi:short-subunit dehydrogenase